jgi:hypothetical protein
MASSGSVRPRRTVYCRVALFPALLIAIVCDPAKPHEVYDGTDFVQFQHGLRTATRDGSEYRIWLSGTAIQTIADIEIHARITPPPRNARTAVIIATFWLLENQESVKVERYVELKNCSEMPPHRETVFEDRTLSRVELFPPRLPAAEGCLVSPFCPNAEDCASIRLLGTDARLVVQWKVGDAVIEFDEIPMEIVN